MNHEPFVVDPMYLMRQAGSTTRRCRVCGEGGHDKRNCPIGRQETGGDDDDSYVEVMIILYCTFVHDICLILYYLTPDNGLYLYIYFSHILFHAEGWIQGGEAVRSMCVCVCVCVLQSSVSR